jgi:hypothetical protein
VLRTCNFSLFLMLIYLVSEPSFNVLMADGPPLVTDDTGTPGHNKWEINIAYRRNNTKLEETTRFSVDANYGFGEKTQLNLIIPHTYINHDEERNFDHLGNIQFATKYRFIDEIGGFFSVSATPTISLPTGNHRSKPDYFFPLEFESRMKSLHIGSQIGYVIHSDKGVEEELFYGFFSEYFFEKIDVLGEIFGLVTKHTKTNAPQFNVGLRYKFNELFSIMGSAGKSFEGRDSGGVDFQSYAGVRFNF